MLIFLRALPWFCTFTRSIVGISLGTFLAVAEETKFDLFGFTIHEISAVAEAMRLVLTQKLLVDTKFDPIEG